MPNSYIKKISKETGKSEADLEANWAEAKKAASKSGHPEDWGYITSIFKKISKIDETSFGGFRSFLTNLSEARKPKPFYAALTRSNSRKWQIVTKPDDKYISVVRIDIDEKNYAITVDGEPIIWVHKWLDWDRQWDWGKFGSGAGTKIEKMVQYIQSID